MTLALERYRMLDLSRMLPGPMASSILADMGMDVIKVEEPEPRYGMGRDPLTQPDPSLAEETSWAAYNSLARNKRSIALNLLDAETRSRAQEIFYHLANHADLILEGYRPGVAEWMGVDYPTIRAFRPDIVYCSISGFGQSGPYVKYPGHNALFSAVSGATNFDDDGIPLREGFPLGDMSGSLYASTAVLAALLHREHTGQGQYIDVPMTSTAMSFNTVRWATYFRKKAMDQEIPEPLNQQATLTYLRCKDGKWLTTSNEETVFWENFCNALSRPEYIPLRRAVGPAALAMVRDIQELFLTRSRSEWLQILVKSETCVAPVHDMEGALENPQVRHLEIIHRLKHPTRGSVTQVNFPVHLSQTPATIRNFAPLLGEHTREIMISSGYSESEIAELERARVVRTAEYRP